MNRFLGHVGLQQRVLPVYRARLFDSLADACEGGVSVFAGEPCPGESIATTDRLQRANFVPARNRHFRCPDSRFYLLWQAGLVEWLTCTDPDALIVEANPRYLSTRLAVHWMHTRGKPVIGWGLGAPHLVRPFARLREGRRRKFLRLFDAMIAYSQKGLEDYRRQGFPPELVFVALNAVAPRPAHPPPERPTRFQERPVVLFVGRLQARKRIDNLLYACAQLPEALQPRLWIIGEGPARENFQALAGEVYPLAEFHGEKRGAELVPFFLHADLFVLPGTGGLAVQEAMSYGLPVIVAEGDGTQSDLVRVEGETRAGNGWSVPPDDIQALKQAICEALSDPARLRRLGTESYRIVAEEANLDVMVEVFIKALQTVSMKSS